LWKLLQKGGEIISEILGDDLQISDTETSIEINFAVMKFKYVVKQQKKIIIKNCNIYGKIKTYNKWLFQKIDFFQ
jgi:hypothetical protein